MSEPTGQFEHHGEGSAATPDVTTTDTSPISGGDNSGNGSTSGGHPAWDEVLGILPSQLHGPVSERLGKWDAGVQERIGKVHSEYEWAKPYKGLADSGANPEQLQQAHAFYQHLNNNPRGVYDFIAQHYGFNTQATEQGQPTNDDTVDLDDYNDDSQTIENHPRFQQMQQQVEGVTQFIQQQQQAQTDAWANNFISTTMERLEQQYQGAFNGQIVSTLAAAKIQAGVAPEKAFDEAASEFASQINSARSAPRAGDSAPTVISPGGGSPVAPSTSKMNPNQRRTAGVEMLQAAMRQQ